LQNHAYPKDFLPKVANDNSDISFDKVDNESDKVDKAAIPYQ
jgi:hypothetical protein